MRYIIIFFSICVITHSCRQDDDPSNFTSTTAMAADGNANGTYGGGHADNGGGGTGSDGNNYPQGGCPGTVYPDWQLSPYVLPYPVGKTYGVNLSHCSGSYHSAGQPDQFAIDFRMNIGTLITAAREGTVIYVQQNGQDYSFPNNLVVVQHNDGTYAQYMHLTYQGALTTVGSNVTKGDSIGFSGATGLAGYPHLHYVVTIDDWAYPYTSIPYTFSNTEANPVSLISGRSYTALPY